jgi:hypothetical protein
MSQFQQEFVTTVIEHYGLELEDERVETVVSIWFQTYDPAWVVKALVEALYRGRYKVKSVDNILRDWQRRGAPLYRFTPNYEREILHSLRLNPEQPATIVHLATPTAVDTSPPAKSIDLSPVTDLEHLDPEEAEPFQHHERSPQATRWGSTDEPDRSTPESIEVEDLSLDPNVASLPSMPDRSPIENEHNPPDTKLHLFHKLREIVDPNDRRRHYQNASRSMW